VASWTSTVSSLLPSFAMVLFSYPVARTILNASKQRNTTHLLTPYQLSMLLGAFSGSIGSLWAWFKYRGWNKREHVNSIAKGSIMLLVFVSLLG
jgi:H+/Cl- antiporter ClcA